MNSVSGRYAAALTRARCRDASEYPNFARLLGTAAWARLPAVVRDRFPATHRADEVVHYAGTMNRVEATIWGRLFAQLARVFDTPVAPWTGDRVETRVRVYPRPQVRGVVWERIYLFPGRAPVTVRSTKRLDGNGQLVESLGCGLRMKLSLSEEGGSLRFTSTGYYFRILGMTVPLPRWFPPGITHVIHKDEGAGRFRFTMFTVHPWFGTMFYQEGVFEKRAGESGARRLFPSLLGSAYESLPPSLKIVHGSAARLRVSGRASITRGSGLLARVAARVFALPHASDDVPISVVFERTPTEEKWTRDFDGQTFATTLFEGRNANAGLLCERFGPFVFAMAPVVDAARLNLLVRRWSLLGCPLPRALAPGGETFEEDDNGVFRFHVEMSVPLVGLIVRYKGWLIPD